MDNNNNQQLSRKERERLHRRQEIVNAAREVFALRGFSAATLEEIAERAEFGKGTLYSYFQSKDELFETVIADIFDEIVQIAADTCSASGAGLEESYRDFASRLLRHLFENYGIYFLMMREMHNMHHQSHFATLFPDLLLLLAEPLRRSLSEAVQAEHQPEQLGFMFLTMILSLFRSSMHMLGLQNCQTDSPPPAVSHSDIERSIERCVNTLEHVYFNGILSMTNTNTAE
jgi:TetR/AcrR family transcriptional regulator, repressor of fatR-cypB operon